VRNPIYEQALNNEGVEYVYLEKVPIDDINAAAGLRNQARLDEPVDDALQNNYADRMKAGDQFPPLVLHRPSQRGKFVPLDGNQRLGASNRPGVGKKWWDAYLVQCDDPVVIDRITWTFNNKVNGKRLTPEEAMEHALTFVMKHGWEILAAATQWGVNKSTLANRLSQERVRIVLDKNKVHRGASFSSDHYKRLAPLLRLGEDVLTQVGKVVASAGLSTTDCALVVDDVMNAKTTAAKARVVNNLASCELVRQRRAETAGGRISNGRPTPRAQLMARMGQVERLLMSHSNNALLPIGREYAAARERASLIVNRFIEAFGLGAKKGVSV
jgi:hypothetical protein